MESQRGHGDLAAEETLVMAEEAQVGQDALSTVTLQQHQQQATAESRRRGSCRLAGKRRYPQRKGQQAGDQQRQSQQGGQQPAQIESGAQQQGQRQAAPQCHQQQS